MLSNFFKAGSQKRTNKGVLDCPFAYLVDFPGIIRLIRQKLVPIKWPKVSRVQKMDRGVPDLDFFLGRDDSEFRNLTEYTERCRNGCQHGSESSKTTKTMKIYFIAEGNYPNDY